MAGSSQRVAAAATRRKLAKVAPELLVGLEAGPGVLWTSFSLWELEIVPDSRDRSGLLILNGMLVSKRVKRVSAAVEHGGTTIPHRACFDSGTRGPVSFAGTS